MGKARPPQTSGLKTVSQKSLIPVPPFLVRLLPLRELALLVLSQSWGKGCPSPAQSQLELRSIAVLK